MSPKPKTLKPPATPKAPLRVPSSRGKRGPMPICRSKTSYPKPDGMHEIRAIHWNKPGKAYVYRVLSPNGVVYECWESEFIDGLYSVKRPQTQLELFDASSSLGKPWSD